jgi:hypothetical protein
LDANFYPYVCEYRGVNSSFRAKHNMSSAYFNKIYANEIKVYGNINSDYFIGNGTYLTDVIKGANDTLNSNFLYSNSQNAILNITALDNRFMTGGFKSFYFTNHTSDIAGMYNTTLSLTDINGGSTLSAVANDGSNVLFQFLAPIEPTYAVASGTRNFHIIAKVDSASTAVQLRGLIYITNTTGGNLTLLRNSTLSIPITTDKAEYILTSLGGVVVIEPNQRILFQIVSEKVVGSDPTVTLYLEDDDSSRLDVPSPVSSVDISGLVPYVGANLSVDLNNKNITTTGSIFSNFIGSITNFISKLWVTNIQFNGTINGTGNIITTGNISTLGYFYGQPLDGMLGSGIIWANGTNSYAEININCSGLVCSWSNFKVRLINTSLDIKYCDVPASSTTLTDNQHSVLYIDNDCNVQETSFETYLNTPISPGGIADFANIITYSGGTENINGLGLEGKGMIKIRKFLAETMHLDVVSGLNRQLNTFPKFNITNGKYVYLRDIVNTTKQDTGVNNIEWVYHSGVGTWQHLNGTGINMTTCDTGTGFATCTNANSYRRHFIFNIGYVDGVDSTGVHQLLPSQTTYYTTLAQCIDTNDYPLTYTLPSYYDYGAVLLYAYCGRASDTGWTGSWIDLRAVKSGDTATGGLDTSVFLTKDGTTALTNNWQVGNFNITNISTIQAKIYSSYGKFGINASGTSCTITEITQGIITGATCSV